MPKAAVGLVLGLLSVAGCSVFSPGDSVPPASVSGKFDGNYQGTSELVKATGKAGCPAGRPGVIEIGDGSLSYAYAPNIVFNTHLLPGGELKANAGDFTLQGRIDGNHLTMTVESPDCESTYSAYIIWNHA